MRTLYFIILIGLVSCAKEEPGYPLPEDKLIEVLIDAHVAEAALQNLRGGLKDSMENVYYDQICAIRGIERVDFDSSMALLRERPIDMERIYTEAMNELDRRAAAKKSK